MSLCACELVQDSSHGGTANYTIMVPFGEIWYWLVFSDSKKAVARGACLGYDGLTARLAQSLSFRLYLRLLSADIILDRSP